MAFKPIRKEKDAFTNMAYIDEMNKMFSKSLPLYRDYQINPFTLKTLQFATPKITDRPRASVGSGHELIRDALRKGSQGPMERFPEPQTEAQRIGWWRIKKSQCSAWDNEHCDERFRFSHKTADFIKTAAMIKDYDKVLGSSKSKKEQSSGVPSKKPAK